MPITAINEVRVDQDIIVLANPEIANLPNWVVGLVAAGGLAAALSNGGRDFWLVISTSVSRDLIKRTLKPDISEKHELLTARFAAAGAVIFAVILASIRRLCGTNHRFCVRTGCGVFLPGDNFWVFSTNWMNMQGAVSGMVTGIPCSRPGILSILR